MGTTQSGAKNGPQNGSEVLLDQLNAQGVDGIFASPIAVMAPIWEALTRRAYDKPRYFRCRHELLAVSLERRGATTSEQMMHPTDTSYGPRERILYVFEFLELQARSPEYRGWSFPARTGGCSRAAPSTNSPRR